MASRCSWRTVVGTPARVRSVRHHIAHGVFSAWVRRLHSRQVWGRRPEASSRRAVKTGVNVSTSSCHVRMVSARARRTGSPRSRPSPPGPWDSPAREGPAAGGPAGEDPVSESSARRASTQACSLAARSAGVPSSSSTRASVVTAAAYMAQHAGRSAAGISCMTEYSTEREDLTSRRQDA